jgi:ABC-type Fe3+-hydroxamate transport system substrate-binding protein
MLRRLIVPIALAVMLCACTSKSDTSSSTTRTQARTAGGLSIAAQFAPDPPKQGPETITVTVKDAAGTPIKGAAVKIATNMPAMSMAGPTLTPADGGDGTYAAQTNLNYATQWVFDISVAANGKNGTVRVTKDVKERVSPVEPGNPAVGGLRRRRRRPAGLAEERPCGGIREMS